MNYEDLEELGYDFKQINQILKAKDLGLDFSELNIQISADVMRKIIEINPTNLTADRIKLLANCIKNNYDYTQVLDTKTYNYKQAAHIVDAMYKKVNHKIIANPAWTANQMKYAKQALVAGFPEELIKYINPSQLKSYKSLHEISKKCDFDLLKYIKEGYNLQQLTKIIQAHQYGYNLEKYISPKYDIYQLNEVYAMVKFIKENKVNIDLSKICSEKFTAKGMRILFGLELQRISIDELYTGKFNTSQMNVIAIAAKNKLNYKLFLDPDFSAEQMNNIFIGLNNGYDAKLYANKEIAAPVMKMLFDVLKWNEEYPDKTIDVSLLANPKIKYQEIQKYIKQLKTGTLDEILETTKILSNLQKKDSVPYDEPIIEDK